MYKISIKDLAKFSSNVDKKTEYLYYFDTLENAETFLKDVLYTNTLKEKRTDHNFIIISKFESNKIKQVKLQKTKSFDVPKLDEKSYWEVIYYLGDHKVIKAGCITSFKTKDLLEQRLSKKNLNEYKTFDNQNGLKLYIDKFDEVTYAINEPNKH